MEFYLDENGKKTTVVNKEGKARRSQAKVILLGICYGKTIKTIAEDLHVSEEKATEIYNAVLANVGGLKHFMEESEAFCRQHGYVETKWGRRRYIPDMLLEPFEVVPEGLNAFDPFFDSEELGVVDDTERLRRQYVQELMSAKWKSQKEKIKERAKVDGFKVKENTKKIEDATRQIVNSRIQGSASDMSKTAIRLIGTDEHLKKLDFHMMLLIHDEVIGECPIVLASQAVKYFVEDMLGSAKDVRSGAAVDPSMVLRWYGKEYDLEHEDIPSLIDRVWKGEEDEFTPLKKE